MKIRLRMGGVGAVALAVLVASLIPAVTAAKAPTCKPTPGSTACLSWMFRDDGAHYNAKAWAQIVQESVGNPKKAGNAKLREHYQELLNKAKTNAQAIKIVHQYETAIGAANVGKDYGRFWSKAYAYKVCDRSLKMAGFRPGAEICSSWYGSESYIITGWQFVGGATNGVLQVNAIYPNMRFQGGMMPQAGLIEMLVPNGIHAKITPAWHAPDSPLPLIAYFNAERDLRFEGAPSSLTGDNQGVAHGNAMAVGQLLAFWGYDDAPTVLGKNVLKVMKAAGFDPVMAGGPNVPAGTALPSFGHRPMVGPKTDIPGLRAAGWRYQWPAAILLGDGVPALPAVT